MLIYVQAFLFNNCWRSRYTAYMQAQDRLFKQLNTAGCQAAVSAERLFMAPSCLFWTANVSTIFINFSKKMHGVDQMNIYW